MAKDQVLADAKVKLAAAQDQVFVDVYDGGYADGDLAGYNRRLAEEGQPPVTPVDTTPYSEADMQGLRDQVAALQADLERVKSDDASDKAAIAAGLEKLAAIAAILSPVVVEPQPEAGV